MALGLWASFTLTAAVTAWFIVRIVATLREHERLLREAARSALNDEAVLRMGTLAAGAAHELGTPLTTMAVVVGEMRRDADTPARRRDAEILDRADRRLPARARQPARRGRPRARRQRASAKRSTRSSRRRSRASGRCGPDVPLEAHADGPAPAPEIVADPSLRQALLILLNNAADASPGHVDVEARWDAESLHLAVGDRGAGVPAGEPRQARPCLLHDQAAGKGTGIGLVLTASTVDRLGGTVRWSNRADGGLVAQIRLPLTSLDPANPAR